jgi:CelD/BcsL family acetyltransferase involved in cellulose biosynthesis/glycosyltransferase involved in cell wall biosynthesis
VNVAFPLARVGPDAAGGAEQVLARLDRGLAAAGHRSIVIAPAGSEVEGELVALPEPPPILEHAAWIRAHQALRAALARVLSTTRVDVVHLHGLDFACYLPPPGPPALVTLHLPASCYRAAALRPPRPLTFLQPVSAAQRATFAADLPLLGENENGVDLDAFHPAVRKRGFALALGRVCAAKGFDLALDAAARAGMPLAIAGPVQPFPEHLRYFDERIRPRLSRRASWLGPVGGARKRRLLAGASCVIVASRVPETCSLAALEALASGTPVVALRSAVGDVVEDGRTGFLVDGVEEMAAALREVGRLDPRACREAAERRFSAAASTARTLELYRRLSRTRVRPADLPGPRAEPRVEEVTSFERLVEVRGEWADLWARSVAATPFTHPAWLLPWGRHLATAPPWAILVWRGRDLVALAPTFRHAGPEGPVVGLLGGAVSDYQDVVVSGSEGAEAVLAHLAARASTFTRCDLEALPPGSALLSAEVARPLVRSTVPEDACAVLPLPSHPDALEAHVSANLLHEVRYRRRRLARAGKLELVRADRSSWRRMLDQLFRLRSARWRSRGEPGMVAGAAIRAFHQDATRALLEAGILRLYALRLDGAPLAAVHGMHAAGRSYVYLTGFDPAAARHGPGTVLYHHVAAEAIAEGALELDFLRGREAYKRRFGTEDRPTLRLVLAASAAHRDGAARAG